MGIIQFFENIPHSIANDIRSGVNAVEGVVDDIRYARIPNATEIQTAIVNAGTKYETTVLEDIGRVVSPIINTESKIITNTAGNIYGDVQKIPAVKTFETKVANGVNYLENGAMYIAAGLLLTYVMLK